MLFRLLLGVAHADTVEGGRPSNRDLVFPWGPTLGVPSNQRALVCADYPGLAMQGSAHKDGLR